MICCFAGPQVAFCAHSIVDGFGTRKPAQLASQGLVGNIVAALDKSKRRTKVLEGASQEQLGAAMQTVFSRALPQVCTCSADDMLFPVFHEHFMWSNMSSHLRCDMG